MLKITALRLHILCSFYVNSYMKFKVSFLRIMFLTYVFQIQIFQI